MDTRFAPERAQHEELFDRLSLRLNTCMPGVIKSFDAATQTCTVTPAIMMSTYQDGVQGAEQLPDIQHVPLFFPFAVLGGFALTLPVQAGDTCLLIFSQRCIDNWHELGGVQPSESTIGGRHHDLSDAFALCCAPSLVDVLTGYAVDGIELRNRIQDVSVKLTDDDVVAKKGLNNLTINDDSLTIEVGSTHKVVVTDTSITTTCGSYNFVLGATGLTVNAPVTFAQDVTFQGKMTDKNAIDHTSHYHFTLPGGGNSSGPI